MVLLDLSPLAFALIGGLVLPGLTPLGGKTAFELDPTLVAAIEDSASDLSTFAGIDSLLEGHELLPLGVTWSYFPGTAEPSPKLEWTQADFDDSAWRRGASPFYFGVDSGGTLVEEFGSGSSSVYLRRTIELPDPKVFERILLELPVDDGFVFYLNGKEERRRSAGDADSTLAFDEGASSQHTTDDLPVPVVDITRAVVPGTNILALRGLSHSEDAETFAIEPRIWVQHLVTKEGERSRFDALRARLSEESDAARIAYLEGRTLQRAGEIDQAVALFALAAQITPSASEPWTRLVECHRELGTEEALLEIMRARIEAGVRTPALMDTWAALFLGDAARSPLDMLAALTDLEVPQGSVVFADALWLGRVLAAGEVARLNCGADEEAQLEEELWGRDRFYSAASTARRIEQVGVDGIPQTVRVATRSLGSTAPTYSIPLAVGAYELRLRFSGDGGVQEPFLSSFDVLIGGARAVRAVEPGTTDDQPDRFMRSLPLFVTDGQLELDLLPADHFDPWLAGLQLRALGEDEFREAIDRWIEAEPTQALPRIQLAQFLLAQGDLGGALVSFEAAQNLPGFQVADGSSLAALRTRLLPKLMSYASVDGLLANAAGDASTASLLDAAKGGQDDFATYLRGRFDQEADRVDDAIASFEALVVEGAQDYRPHLRMAQCLAVLEFASDADHILVTALENGVAAAPELISFLISLRLGPLKMDPWDVLASLRPYDLPEELVVVPTSEEAPQVWKYSAIEPPTVTWSRLAYNIDNWDSGLGVIGAGLMEDVISRSLWNTQTVFARRTIQIENEKLLYPHLRVTANDALDVYLNGTRVLNLGISALGYQLFPLRPSAVVPLPGANEVGPLFAGDNGLGMYANNSTREGCADVGLVQPLGLLNWIQDRLDQDGALRINCGGAAFVAPDGTAWSEDRFFGWGQVSFVDPELPLPDIQGTDNDELYHTNRWFFDDVSTTWYQVPLPNGTYRVSLHFAEIEPGFREAGTHVFSVKAEGKLLLGDYETVVRVGYEAADVHTFEVQVSDGFLDLHLKGKEHWSFLSGLEIVR